LRQESSAEVGSKTVAPGLVLTTKPPLTAVATAFVVRITGITGVAIVVVVRPLPNGFCPTIAPE
jgi:hypothetical protein